MEKIKIKNLRSLTDTGSIDIKPLTVLVGKNSIGKSTFLRMFPLFKQSIGINRSEPILWYSPELVDFGSFGESVTNFDDSKSIEFEFEFDIETNQFIGTAIFNKLYRSKFSNFETYYEKHDNLDSYRMKATIAIKNKYISKVEINFFDYKYCISINNKKEIMELKVNDISVPIKAKFDKIETFGVNYLVPEITISRESKKNGKVIKSFEELIQEEMFKGMNIIKNGRISNYRIYDIISSLYLGSKKEFENALIERIKETVTMNNIFNDLTQIEKFEFFENQYILNGFRNINFVLSLFNGYICDYFDNTQYIAPIRASAQRYYRIQGLAINELSPQGENVPMIMNNMKDTERIDWNMWTNKKFGIEFIVSENESNLSMKLKRGELEINLADTGFGFSQLLPILLYVWRLKSDKKNENKNIIRFGRINTRKHTLIIEQPELHLHPAMQSILIDVFIEMIMFLKETINFSVIMETHSETIINRIGENIITKNKDFTADKVNILLFNELDGKTTIKQTKFAEEGYLEDWPIDFFLPSDVLGDQQ